MALSVSATYTGNDSSGDADVTGVTAAAGTMLAVLVAADNSGASGAAPSVSVTDAAGNTYTQRGTTGLRSSGSSNDGAAQYMFTAPVTSALSSQTITVTSTSGTDLAVVVYVVAPGAGESVAFVEAGTPVDGLRTSHACTASIGVEEGQMFIGHAAVETGGTFGVNVTGDTDTVNGSWSTLALAKQANFLAPDEQCMSSAAQYKIVTATGAQTWAGATSSSRDGAANYMILEAIPAFSADPGVYTITGADAALNPTFKIITPDTGAYTLTGAAADVLRGSEVAADGGSYALTGEAATVSRAYELTATAGSFTVSTPNADLLRRADGRVPAADGAYDVTGAAATVLRGRVAEADIAFYFLEGAAADFGIVRAVVLSAGSYSVTGAEASLQQSGSLSAEAGIFALTGAAANLTMLASYTIGADPAAFSVSGVSAVLTASNTPAPEEDLTVHAPSYSYWLRRKSQFKKPELPPPPKVEVTIDPAVVAQAEAERRAAEMLRARQEALARAEAARETFPAGPRPTRGWSPAERPQPVEQKIERKTVTVDLRRPEPVKEERRRNYMRLGPRR